MVGDTRRLVNIAVRNRPAGDRHRKARNSAHRKNCTRHSLPRPRVMIMLQRSMVELAIIWAN